MSADRIAIVSEFNLLLQILHCILCPYVQWRKWIDFWIQNKNT